MGIETPRRMGLEPEIKDGIETRGEGLKPYEEGLKPCRMGLKPNKEWD